MNHSLSVNEVIARWPSTIGTLNSLGIDTCCGGAESLSAAAAGIGVTPESLVQRIEETIAGLPR